MLRNTWCASVETELSNAPAAWTCDSSETLSETRTSMLDFPANHSCIPPCGSGSRREGLPQHAPGAIERLQNQLKVEKDKKDELQAKITRTQNDLGINDLANLETELRGKDNNK